MPLSVVTRFTWRAALVLLPLATGYTQEASLRGKVLDARTGEPLEKVRIAIDPGPANTVTRPGGVFEFDRLPPGARQLRISAPGYALLKYDLPAGGAGGQLLEISLQSDADTIRTRVEVKGNLFEGIDGTTAPSEHTLNKAELQALGTSIIADPLRSVQALPSVTSSNDGRGEVSVRGSSYDRVALMVDGVLLDGFLHQITADALGSDRERASFSIITPDRISEVSLLNGAFPASHGLRTAGIVQLRTRDGNREKRDTRISTGLTLGTAIVHDGPFASKRGTYLFGLRSSTLNPLNINAPDQFVRFEDGQSKLLYDLHSRHRVGVNILFGGFQYDDRKSVPQYGRNSVTKADSTSLAALLNWDWTVNGKLTGTTKLFHTQVGLNAFNRESLLLGRLPRKQWGGRQDWALQTSARGLVQFGAYVREIGLQADGFAFAGPQQQSRILVETLRGTTVEGNYHAQTTQPLAPGLTFTAGVRAETNRLTKETYASPRVALAYSPARRPVSLRLGYGRHRQFADMTDLLSLTGNRNLRAELTDHFTAGLDLRTGERSRLRLELFERRDRGQIFQLAEPRLLSGRPVDSFNRPDNSLSGRARGFEAMLQRRSGNRFSGWASYSYLSTRMKDSVLGLTFPTDFDQRHTGSLFGAYRLTETWSLNGVYRLASGTPFAGFVRREAGARYFLAADRNALRLRSYGRFDLRLNKTFHWKASRWSVVLEGLNVLNQGNVTYNGIERYDRMTGQIHNPITNYGLTRTATAGVTVQF